jgi:hypothetical protein
MEYRRLGRTEIMVSEIGFPMRGLTIGNEFVGREPDAIRLLQESYDAGVVFFDAADSDHSGYSEELLAKGLGNRRHEIIVATKVGYDFYTPITWPGDRGFRQNFDSEYLRLACERSLRRLGTEYIDIYQLHHPPVEALRRDDLWMLLEALVREGKVRSVGVSVGAQIDVMDVREVLTDKHIDGFQLPYLNAVDLLVQNGCDSGANTVVLDHRLDDMVITGPQVSSSTSGLETPSEVDMNGSRNLQEMFRLMAHHGQLDQMSLILTVLLLHTSVCSVMPWVRQLDDVTQAASSIAAVRQCEECNQPGRLLQ